MMPDVIFFYTLLFIFGLAVGSFLNVVIFRYRANKETFALENISGRSHCPHCRKTLQWFELIPIVSFIVQGGKCRSCHKPLSFQYPLVELAGGLFVAGVPLFLNWFYHFSNTLFVAFRLPHLYYLYLCVWVAIFLIWLLIAIIDLRHYLIPNELNAFLGVLGLAVTAIFLVRGKMFPPFHDSFLRQYVLLFSPFVNVLANHIAGAIVGALFFGALYKLSRGRAMGFGDVKLAVATGFILGWPDIALAIIISFILGGLCGIVLVIWKRKKMHDKIPFGPFFILGSILTVLLGYGIVFGYFGLFNI